MLLPLRVSHDATLSLAQLLLDHSYRVLRYTDRGWKAAACATFKQAAFLRFEQKSPSPGLAGTGAFRIAFEKDLNRNSNAML